MDREEMETDVHDDLEYEAFEPATQGKPPGRMAGFFMLWTGLGLALFGIALPTAHYLSLPDYQIGERLAELNIENGELFVGGLLLLAMGLVLRTAVKVARSQSAGGLGGSSHDDPDFILAADQLGTDVAQCLTAVVQISGEVSSLAQSQRDFLQRQSNDESNTDRQETAIFTLAASLDKLNAHIDERVHGLDVQVRSHFDNVANAIHETRQLLESHLAGSAAQVAPAPAAMAAPAPMPQAAPVAPAAPAAQEPTIDFFENMEMSNQPIPSDFGSVPPAATPNPPLPGAPSGGSLDALLPDDSIQRALDQDQFPGLGQ